MRGVVRISMVGKRGVSKGEDEGLDEGKTEG